MEAMQATEGTVTAVEAHGLSRTFRGRTAVDSLELRLPIGSIFALLGPNGSGKTTTVRMLTTILAPTGGRARVMGYDVVRQADQVRQVVAVVPQGAVMSYQLDLFGNIYTYLILAGHRPAEARRRAREALDRFDLTEHQTKRPHELSGGLRRRAELARVLARRVPVLLLDEPTTGLDPEARRSLWERVRALRADGCFTFLTTHSFEEAGALADIVGIMRDGRLVALGTPAQLTACYGVASLEEVYFKAVGQSGAVGRP